jgi:signal transduction histidine kinase
MQTLDKAIADTEQAIAESRDAIHDLRSDPAQHRDLVPALEAFGVDMAAMQSSSRTSPGFRVIVEGESKKLLPAVQDEVYKIACELLRNAFRHAKASHIEAEIRFDKNQLRLRIRDDGKGIDPNVLEVSRRPGHWGLSGIRERAQRIGSQLSLWSQPGAGAEAEIIVPGTVAYQPQGSVREVKLSQKERRV